MTTLRVKPAERVVLFEGSLPLRAFELRLHQLWPGPLGERHWSGAPFAFETLPDVRGPLPTDWFAEASLREYRGAFTHLNGLG